LIAEYAWRVGDPGMVFLDVMNRYCPTPKLGIYQATNPCGEQPLLPYESCNLGNVNLGKFVKTMTNDELRMTNAIQHFIDWQRLEEVVRLGVHFQDNVIDLCEYPIPQLQKMAKTTRKIGLGVMGWADMLIKLGVRYDSDEALKLAEKTAKFIQETARGESVKLGKKRGSFPAFKDSIWKKKGFKTMRNSTVNTVAPTGTISIIAGCSSGIEPLFALAYRRENILDLGKTSLLEVNEDFKITIAKLLNCYIAKDNDIPETTIEQSNNLTMKKLLEKVLNSGSCRNIKEIPQGARDVFRVSMEIPFAWHIKMQAAWQKYTDAAVSKTINLPNSATVDDIKNAYLLAYETGCKGITVYRDGCRGEQVLNVGKNRKAKSQEPRAKSQEVCPECGGEMEFTDGCSLCRSCGFSKCSV
jgi:ribonucleoside-diphosphate reductase alpha chain